MFQKTWYEFKLATCSRCIVCIVTLFIVLMRVLFMFHNKSDG
jgi:hypothetical protein